MGKLEEQFIQDGILSKIHLTNTYSYIVETPIKKEES